MGILIFVLVAVASSLACHFVMKSYILASVVSAFVAAFSFQLLNYLNIGYLDPFAIIAVLITWLIGFVLSLLVGLAFVFERNKRQN
jgi:hypothetical protein